MLLSIFIIKPNDDRLHSIKNRQNCLFWKNIHKQLINKILFKKTEFN